MIKDLIATTCGSSRYFIMLLMELFLIIIKNNNLVYCASVQRLNHTRSYRLQHFKECMYNEVLNL